MERSCYPQTTSPPKTLSSTTAKPPVYFWKDSERPHGIFCQWYHSPFTDPSSGQTFNCTEQWMMWSKAQLCGDDAVAAKIMGEMSPRKQKALGRQVQGFDAGLWDEKKMEIVEQGNFLKFTQSTDAASIPASSDRAPVPLRDMLLATNDRELIEASPMDRIWGIGYGAASAETTPREKWGMNLLGKALMNVRERIRGEMAAGMEKGERVEKEVEGTGEGEV